MPRPLKQIAFFINRDKSGAAELAAELMHIATQSGCEWKEAASFPLEDDFLRGMDACCVIGGDGTLLSVVRQSAEYQVPVIGINRGGLGFLTTFSADEARASFDSVLQGRYTLSHRSTLECRTADGTEFLALNDVVLKEKNPMRLVSLEVWADGELVTEYVCDGLILSTPTGSTAYNLSSGGPIIHPRVKAIALTPICPHTLSNRSLIFPDDVRLEIIHRGEDSMLFITMDGHSGFPLEETGGSVTVVSSRRVIPLVQRTGYCHYDVLQTKLGWHGGHREKRRGPPAEEPSAGSA